MPDPPSYDPDKDEFELFLKMIVSGIAKDRPPLSADLVVTDPARKKEQDLLFEKEERRFEKETAAFESAKDAAKNYDHDNSITITFKDHYGRERQQEINLTQQSVEVIGQLVLFPHTYQIDKDDFGKLTAYSQQQMRHSPKAEVSEERDLESKEIKSFTISDKFGRIDRFDHKSSPSDYSKLLLRAGTGHVSYELTKELQQTTRQWQERWERDHIEIKVRDDQEPNKVWYSHVDLTELDREDLQNYKDFSKEYDISKRDLAKLDTRMRELDKSLVLPKHELDEDKETPQTVPPEKAHIEFERDQETGEIKQFTIYDQSKTQHVFNEKTTPAEYRKLEQQEGYGNVKVELDAELQETARDWQNQYERSHITLHMEREFNASWACEIDLAAESPADLNHYKREQEFYGIDPRDAVKLDKWIKEHKLELNQELESKVQSHEQEKHQDQQNVISYTPEPTKEIPRPQAQELEITKLSTPELNHLAQLDFHFKISLDDTYKLTRLLDERYEREHINIREPVVENKMEISIPRELDLNNLSSKQLQHLHDSSDKYYVSDADKEKLDSYIQTRAEHNLRYDEKAEIIIERDDESGQIKSFEIQARLQDGHGFKETREFDKDTIPEVWDNLVNTKQGYGYVKVELTPELELVAQYWQEKFEQEHVRFNMPAASGDTKSYYLNLEESKMTTLQYIKDHASEYAIAPKDEIKLDYQIGLKQLHEQEVKYQQDKVIDIEEKLSSHIAPDLDQQQVDYRLSQDAGHDLTEIKPDQQVEFIYEAQKLTGKEVEQQYGLDQLANTLYNMAAASPDYERQQGLQVEREPQVEPGMQPPAGESQQLSDSSQTSTQPEIQQDIQTDQNYDQDLDR
jgi:hypothetical protein